VLKTNQEQYLCEESLPSPKALGFCDRIWVRYVSKFGRWMIVPGMRGKEVSDDQRKEKPGIRFFPT
jgi:hypothetical protein